MSVATTPDPTPDRIDGRRVLCRTDDVTEAGKGLAIAGLSKTDPAKLLDIFVIPDGASYRAYVNICPHQGTRLDFKPDTFLDVDRELIQCTTHWARFRKADGVCIKGPCLGRKLIGVPITVRDDGLIVLGGRVTPP